MEVGQKYSARLSSFGLTRIMVYVFRSNAVSSRIMKKETFPFSLFEMHGARSLVETAFVVVWSHKHKDICFSVQRRFIANKEKGYISFFLFPYSKCMMLDHWYKAHLSSFGLTSIKVYVFLSNAVS